jgi:hypothetical protein
MRPSLRANGSRVCGPDDRLREAIHRAAIVVWIASSLTLLALTVNGHSSTISRREAPELCKNSSPSKIRGRREDQVRAAPAVSCAMCTKKCAHEHTGSAESIRPSLRNGFTAYSALSPVNGLSCHRRRADTSAQLDASVGASGPHDFAVRIGRARQSQLSRPPHPTARFVTIASRPSCRVRRAESNH